MLTSEFFLQFLLYLLVIGVPLWALISGGGEERTSALIFIFATLATKFIGFHSDYKDSASIILMIDGVMALSYLAIALVFRHIWTALMMLAMGALFTIHSFYLINDRPLDQSFAFAGNLATVFLLLALAQGVWSSRRRSSGRT